MKQTIKFARKRIDRAGKIYKWWVVDEKRSNERFNHITYRAGAYGYW